MADIASAFVKMNDIEIADNQPLATNLNTKIGANINAFIDFYNLGNSQVFLTSGSFTVPANVTSLMVFGCGGGGGGAVSGIFFPFNSGGGGGEFYMANLRVTPSQVIPVTIGGGGAGGLGGGSGSTGNAGASGGNTIFSSLTFNGGTGGVKDAASTRAITPVQKGAFSCYGGAGNGGLIGPGGEAGESSIYGAGGTGGGYIGSGFIAGGGGGASIGLGGAGNGAGAGTSAAANSGGGGGGGAYVPPNYLNGGNGGSGILVVTW